MFRDRYAISVSLSNSVTKHLYHVPPTFHRATDVVAPKESFQFERLPAEMMLRVMFYTPVNDLKNLVKTGKFVRATWKIHSKRVFKGVQSAQSPEFVELFGMMSAFGKRVSRSEECTPGNVTVRQEGGNNSRQVQDETSEMQGQRSPRTAEQTQDLTDAIDSMEWEEGVKAPCSLKSQSSAIPTSKVLQNFQTHAGWVYLDFLSCLQDKFDESIDHLNHLGLRIHTREKCDARAVMLTLVRMHWRYITDEEEEDFVEKKDEQHSTEDRTNSIATPLIIFELQSQTVRDMVRRILRFIITRMTGLYRLDRRAAGFLNRYAEARASGPNTMMDEDTVRTFLQQTIIGLVMGTCFFYGTSEVLATLCGKSDERYEDPNTQTISLAFQNVLTRRVGADWMGLELQESESGGWIGFSRSDWDEGPECWRILILNGVISYACRITDVYGEGRRKD